MHAIFAIFIYFFIPRPSFTARTPNKDQKIEQLFYCLMVQVLSPGDIHKLRGERFVHAICKRSQKCLVQNVARFCSLGPIPMIQSPFNSSCVALQYESGTKFFHQAVPESHDIQSLENSVQLCGVSVCFLHV